jgi:hypothetical protein
LLFIATEAPAGFDGTDVRAIATAVYQESVGFPGSFAGLKVLGREGALRKNKARFRRVGEYRRNAAWGRRALVKPTRTPQDPAGS